MTTEVTVEAKNEVEAKDKALKKLELKVDKKINKTDLELELIEEKSGFLGIGKKKVFRINLNEKEDEVEESIDDLGKEKEDEGSIENSEKETEDEVEAEDGDVELIIDEEGVYIQLTPPEGNGEAVSLIEVEEILGAKEIEDVNYDKISEALTEDIYEPVKVAPRKEELDRNAEIRVDVSADGMKAYLSTSLPLGGKEATLTRIEDTLEEVGVTYGIKNEKLKELVNDEEIIDEAIERVLVAEGVEPLLGKDAEVNFKFNIKSEEKKVQKLEDGSVDYRNLNRINNVKPGDILATKKPTKPGTPGTTVTGKDVKPKPPKDKKIPSGKNTILSSDELNLQAEIEGQVSYNGDKIEVMPVHTVNGDVDLSTGNIKFVGTVVVEGDVRDGMEIKAKNDINVKGSVHGAKLEAQGEILIKNGFIGKDKGEIKADGNVQVRFIENGKLTTENDLIVTEAIMHSDIDAARIIRIENKGLIVGGIVRAGREIDAKVVGSNLATKTKIFVGITPALRDQYNNLMKKLEDYQKELDEALKTIKYLKKRQKEDDGELSEKERNLLSQKTRTRFKVAKNIEELKKEKISLETRLEEGKNGKIKVQDKLYSGVEITIGTEVKKVTKQLSNLQFYVADGEIKKGSYS
ncbi:FapA family protein [Selenihalanaerobacter shriftii]|uniref:Flagellar Assembly Protein A N-terminal region domain-containing protein n=1 Tax=Selenihalanaerobacter shriftii TaxID=142842 RepID=A0A1T4MDD4_9FIRM|nr:FapA family protein [Selenihalanaerobacter shriftii]SJZ64764.1 hypothetical protein SAMN02745118_01442 [Selenihalanaerobacter shriftii]